MALVFLIFSIFPSVYFFSAQYIFLSCVWVGTYGSPSEYCSRTCKKLRDQQCFLQELAEIKLTQIAAKRAKSETETTEPSTGLKQ